MAPRSSSPKALGTTNVTSTPTFARPRVRPRHAVPRPPLMCGGNSQPSIRTRTADLRPRRGRSRRRLGEEGHLGRAHGGERCWHRRGGSRQRAPTRPPAAGAGVRRRMAAGREARVKTRRMRTAAVRDASAGAGRPGRDERDGAGGEEQRRAEEERAARDRAPNATSLRSASAGPTVMAGDAAARERAARETRTSTAYVAPGVASKAAARIETASASQTGARSSSRRPVATGVPSRVTLASAPNRGGAERRRRGGRRRRRGRRP